MTSEAANPGTSHDAPPSARLLDLPCHYPRLTLAVMVAITVALAVFAARIGIDSSIENLLPRDDPSRRFYEHARALFGDEEITVVAVFADDVFAPASLAKIARLSERLAELDGVHEVLSLGTVKAITADDTGVSLGKLMRTVPATQKEADAFRVRVLANPLYLRNVVAADGRAAALSVVYEPMSDAEFLTRGLEDQVRTLVAAHQGPERLVVTGMPTLKAEGARLMERDVQRFTPLALLIVVVVLALAFRTVRGVLVPLATIVVGVVWTSGVMVLAGSAITMGTLVLNPLLMVVGIASGVHLVSAYYDALAPDRTPIEVVRTAMQQVRLPVAIAAVTTLIGFGTLVFTPIPAIREFGLYSVFGIAVTVVAALTIVPAMLVLLPLPILQRSHGAHQDGAVARLVTGIGSWSVAHRRAVLLGSLVVLALSVAGMARLRVETDYVAFFHPETPVRRANAEIAARLAGTQPVYVVIEGDAPDAAVQLDVLRGVEAMQRAIDRYPGVDKTISLVDYVALLRGAVDPDATGTLPDSQEAIDQLLLLVDPKDVRPVLSREHATTNIIVRTTLSGSTEVAAFVAHVDALAAAHLPRHVRARATGTLVLLAESADALAWGQVTGLWQELAVLLALLSLLFLSVRVGILALIPNVVPVLVLFGIMGWSGITLNVSTAMIAAIAIGIAIDDTIHLLGTFSAELRRSGDQEQAIVDALRGAGQAAFFIAIALAAGFAVVCLSSFAPVRHFGMLSGVTMIIGLAVELLLSPALMTTTRIITLWDVLFVKLGPRPHEQIPLFAGLRPFQAKIAVTTARLSRAPAGEYLARAGETKEELYVLLSGRAEARARDDTVLRSFERGDVVGEMGFVRGLPRSADVVMVAAGEYLALDHAFTRRLRHYPRIASTVFLNLSRILSDRLEQTTARLAGAPGAQLASARP